MKIRKTHVAQVLGVALATGVAKPTMSQDVDLADLGSGGFRLIGAGVKDRSGRSVSGARLRNIGSTWATVDPALSPETHRVSVYLKNPTGRSERFLPLFYADATVPKRLLAPGDKASTVFPVFFGSFGWTLPEAGPIEVRLTATTGDDANAPVVTSNKLTLNVSL